MQVPELIKALVRAAVNRVGAERQSVHVSGVRVIQQMRIAEILRLTAVFPEHQINLIAASAESADAFCLNILRSQ